MKRLFGLGICAALAATIWRTGPFVIAADDHRLSLAGLSVHRSGQPFTGILFELYPDRSPAKFAAYWRGEQLAHEIQLQPEGRSWVDRAAYLGSDPEPGLIPEKRKWLKWRVRDSKVLKAD